MSFSGKAKLKEAGFLGVCPVKLHVIIGCPIYNHFPSFFWLVSRYKKGLHKKHGKQNSGERSLKIPSPAFVVHQLSPSSAPLKKNPACCEAASPFMDPSIHQVQSNGWVDSIVMGSH